MTEKFRQRAILAKLETVYGTDSTPDGAANAILVSEPTIRPLEGGVADRRLLYPELGASPVIHVGVHQIVEFGVELAGSGTAGTAPGWSPLIKACGFAETVTPTTKVEYEPATGGSDSVSLYFHIGGTLHKLLGARGSCRFVLPRNDVPRIMFAFTGLWADPAAVAQPTTVFTAFQTPLPVSNANTPTFGLHGYEAVMASLEINVGQQVVHRDMVNSESVIIADRQGSGRVTIEAPAIGTQNYFTTAKSNALGALQCVHGVTAGNIIQIDAPKVQILRPGYEDSDGIAMLSMDLVPTRDAGDDEVKITLT